MNGQLRRMWINQPSTLQQYHKLHGVRVLAEQDGECASARIYFLSGDVVSQQVAWSALSEGWPERTHPAPEHDVPALLQALRAAAHDLEYIASQPWEKRSEGDKEVAKHRAALLRGLLQKAEA